MVVNRIHLDGDLAKRISDALNELNEAAKAAVKRDIQKYQNALDELDEKRDKMFDMFTTGVIDQEEYNHQNARLKEERRNYTNLLEQSQCAISDAWAATAQKVLELATNAKTLWKTATVEKKVEILKTVCSNPTLDGASVRYELQKPFTTIAEMNEKKRWRPPTKYERT